MTHIVSCEITGLAGREDPVAFKFDRHLNVFFGLNGSGKTSLLKILHSALSLDASILMQVPFRKAVVEIHTLTYDKTFKLTLDRDALEKSDEPPLQGPTRELVQRRFLARTRRHWSWRMEKGGPDLSKTKRWHHRYLPTTRLYLAITGALPRPGYFEADADMLTQTFTEEGLEQLFATTMKYLWSNYASEIYASVRQAQENGLANILRDVLLPYQAYQEESDTPDPSTARRRVETFLKRRGYTNVDQILTHFESQFHDDKRVRRVVSDINSVEATIEVAISPLANLTKLLASLYSGGKSVRVDERGINVMLPNKDTLDLNLLSSGEKHVLRILVETLSVDQSTIIIDEPELSLHIDWQRSLIGHLQTINPEAQFILATHSPEIMAEVPDQYIVRI